MGRVVFSKVHESLGWDCGRISGNGGINFPVLLVL